MTVDAPIRPETTLDIYYSRETPNEVRLVLQRVRQLEIWETRYIVNVQGDLFQIKTVTVNTPESIEATAEIIQDNFTPTTINLDNNIPRSVGSGFWFFRPRDALQLKKKSPQTLQINAAKFFDELVTILEASVTDEVDDSARRLEVIRDLGRADEELHDRMLRLLGFVGDEISLAELPAPFRVRILEEVTRYYEISGAEDFINFMGFILNSNISIERLYTPRRGSLRYQEFYTRGQRINGEIVDDTNLNFFPTSRDHMTYVLGQAVSNLEEEEIRSIFYNLAPINIVLHSISGSNRLPTRNLPSQTSIMTYQDYSRV